eukprot:GHVU01212459.1.p2 GENE.GHVU01212459.1~~GHVU01212459.1.p2  ORF type:complete len:126 (+),score=6.16 GHVU01212459.1:297-674(+)
MWAPDGCFEVSMVYVCVYIYNIYMHTTSVRLNTRVCLRIYVCKKDGQAYRQTTRKYAWKEGMKEGRKRGRTNFRDDSERGCSFPCPCDSGYLRVCNRASTYVRGCPREWICVGCVRVCLPVYVRM